VYSEPTIQGEIEANLFDGSQMQIWGPTEDAINVYTGCMTRQSIWLESRLSANVSLLPAMDDRTLIGREDGAQLESTRKRGLAILAAFFTPHRA
jgi:hypothetical protein